MSHSYSLQFKLKFEQASKQHETSDDEWKYWWWGSFLGLSSETRLDVPDHKEVYPSV